MIAFPRAALAVGAVTCLLAALPLGCTTAKVSDAARTAPNGAAPALTREAALLRSRQISHVSYTLWFGLDEANADYEGRVVINFQLRPKAKDVSKGLFLDFEGGELKSLKLNGAPLPQEQLGPARYDGHRIAFSVAELQAGNNRVEISFSHPFSPVDHGFHRYVDPQDQAVYVYTDFEPNGAHRMFPCFDQPDLKASFELTVEAPASWTVVSNTQEREVASFDGRRSWGFPPSPRLSTYLFALHAGPFAQWKGDADGIPLRLFARKALAPHVDAKEWLATTVKGLDFFGAHLGYPYPYAKYDQLIVPDLGHGAMENPAAVTFSERYVFRQKASERQRRDRDETILHEMAHMWFGALVTPRWWNGLWLNESLATFLSAFAMEGALGEKSVWTTFAAERKYEALLEDTLPTTHPIEVPVADTNHVNFDSITYGKGAAALKQLRFFVGEDEFQDGLQRYLLRHAARNATVADFAKLLGEAAGRDLGPWQKAWLQSAGTNTVRAEWECRLDNEGEDAATAARRRRPPESRITRFALLQEGTPLRPHKMTVALYDLTSGKARRKSTGEPALPGMPYETFDVAYAGPRADVYAPVGKPCPEFVLLNYNDHDYVTVELDPKSREKAAITLPRIGEALARQSVLATLWNEVLGGKTAPGEYAGLALEQLRREPEPAIVNFLMETLRPAKPEMPSVLGLLAGPARDAFAARLDELARRQLQAAPGGTDQQKQWFRHWLTAAASAESATWLQGLLSGKRKLTGLALDQDTRWELLQALARNVALVPGGVGAVRGLIEQELKADPSDRGKRSSLVADVQLADAAAKSQWLEKILSPGKPYSVQEKGLSLPELRAAMRAFYVTGQEAAARAVVEPYFQTVRRPAVSTEDQDYLEGVAFRMYPMLCDPAVVAEAARLLATPDLAPEVARAVRRRQAKDERCVKLRQSFSSSKTGQ